MILHIFWVKSKSYIKDKKALSLHKLYTSFKNSAFIYSILGTTDNLVDVQDKKLAISKLAHTKFELIDAKKVDGVIFKSTNHGLDADFLNLFDYVMNKLPKHENKTKFRDKYTVASGQTLLTVDYTNALPLFQFK